MLTGFPKNVTKEKVHRGHYRLTRDDGYTVEVKRGVGGWWFGNTGRKVKSLGVAEYDMRNGYTSHDQVGVSTGSNGYRGSPAEKEDRQEGIKVGGRVRWLVTGPALVGTIDQIEIDDAGAPWFHLTFEENHKPVRVDRAAIAPAGRA